MTDDDGSRTFADEDLRRLRHDVRSPLMVISGFARMLGGDRDLSDEERKEFSLRIEQAAEDLRQKLDDALGD
jgi:signal transduction histidine kinase